jgi:hypothetical protein
MLYISVAVGAYRSVVIRIGRRRSDMGYRDGRFREGKVVSRTLIKLPCADKISSCGLGPVNNLSV